MSKKIPFEASILSTKNQFCPRMKIKPEGIQLLNNLMNSINSVLIKTFDQEYESSKKIHTDTALKCAQKSVLKAVPAEFRQLAAAQGQTNLALYKKGELEYDFAKSMKEITSTQQLVKKSKPVAVKPMLTKFTSAVAKVNSLFAHIDVRLDPKAKSLLATYLYKLTARIAARAAEDVPENEILDYTHVVNVLPEFLDSKILEMAHIEGSRNLDLHVSGVDEFKPRNITSLPSAIINHPVLKDENGDISQDTSFPLDPSIFKSGIKKLQMDSSMKFDPSLALNVSQIANRLISEVKTQTEQQNLQEVDFMHLAKAAQGVFPQNVLDHAALSARSRVEDYIKGAFTYKKRKAKPVSKAPPSKKRKISKKSATQKGVKRKSSGKKAPTDKKRRRRVASKSDGKKRRKGETSESETAKRAAPKKPKKDKLDFSKEILEVFVKTFALKSTPSVTINRSGVEKMNICLNDVLKLIVKECETESTTSVEAIRRRVQKYFTGELSGHAMGAGARLLMITRHQNGKQTDLKQAASATKPKRRADDTEKPREVVSAAEQRQSAKESSEESEKGAEKPRKVVSAAEQQQSAKKSTMKQEARSKESTETVPTGGEPEDTE